MRHWRRAVVAAVAVAACAAATRAQRLEHVEDGRRVCVVNATMCGGVARPGGLAFVRIDVENLDDRAHTILVEIASARHVDDADLRVHREFPLGARERALAWFPLPTPLPSSLLRMLVDNGNEQAEGFNLTRQDGLVALTLSDRPELQPVAQALLQDAPSPFTTEPFQTRFAIDEAPTDWRLFTGYHVVLLDGRGTVPAELQEALRRAVFAGAALVVLEPASLPPGALRALLGDRPAPLPVEHGLGTLFALPSVAGAAELAKRVLGTARPLGEGPLPVPVKLLDEQRIPGLGDTPVLVFLSVIIAFAVLAGPVNFWWLRRRQKPLLALITVPVLGFGTTLAILGYGALHDGFGVRGVVASWTWLDQERHEAAVHCARTLFAGRAPDAFTPGPDTLLLAPRGTEKGRGLADRWHCDAASWRLDGGLLPSRTETPLCTVQQGPVRQRLVVRRDGNRLLLLTDGGVQPDGTMVLRDFDGGWWVGEVPHLRAAAAHEAEAALAQLRRSGSQLEVRADQPEPPEAWSPHGHRHGSGYRNGHANGEGKGGSPDYTMVGIGELGHRCFAAEGLAPGSYVAKVVAPAWLDEHGLEVAYDAAVHFVHGKLAPEDLGR